MQENSDVKMTKEAQAPAAWSGTAERKGAGFSHDL